MPTVRPRHMITESDELARALDAAAEIWPECEAERAELLRRIIDKGIQELDRELATKVARRAQAVRQTAGSLDWPAGWREQQLTEWPE